MNHKIGSEADPRAAAPSPIHSTGRGGRGNIGRDPTVYTDGAIVREGVEGLHDGETEYSTGRGGYGNIDPPHPHEHHHHIHPHHPHHDRHGEAADTNAKAHVTGPRVAQPPGVAPGAVSTGPATAGKPKPAGALQEDDYVPEPALRTMQYENYHTGRGGQGNVHKDKYGGHSSAGEQQRADKEKPTSATEKVKQLLHLDK